MIRYHADLVQGDEEWLQARCGILTASNVKLIVSSKLAPVKKDTERAYLYELLSQRITRYVEPQFITDDMLRGHTDEIEARILYAKHYAPVHDMGFITNDKWGFTLGYSPDGLVGDDGAIECKSRRQKYQVQSILEWISADQCVPDYLLQVQTGLLVSERQWIDLISYCGGLPMAVVRVFPDEAVQTAILNAASLFEQKIAEKLARYHEILASGTRLIATERKVEQEMYVG